MPLRKTTVAILYMCIMQILVVFAWTAIKKMGGRIPLFELIFFRSAFALLLLFPITHFRHGHFRGRNISLLFLRALFGFGGIAMSYYAIINMDIGDAATLFNTLPIFVALLAPALLGEAFGKLQFAFIMTAFAGILIILKPDMDIFGDVSIFALLAGLSGSLALICLRKLRVTDSPFIITLYYTIFVAAICAPFTFTNFVLPTMTEWILLASLGIATTVGQLFMSRAFALGRASTISPLMYLSVVGSYAVGILIFSEIPEIYSIIGAAIIVASGVAIIFATPKRQHVPGSTPGART